MAGNWASSFSWNESSMEWQLQKLQQAACFGWEMKRDFLHRVTVMSCFSLDYTSSKFQLMHSLVCTNRTLPRECICWSEGVQKVKKDLYKNPRHWNMLCGNLRLKHLNLDSLKKRHQNKHLFSAAHWQLERSNFIYHKGPLNVVKSLLVSTPAGL